MWVGEIDVHDDRLLRRWWEAAKEGDEDGRDYATFWSFDEAAIAFQRDNPTREQHAIAAIEGDEVLGIAQVPLPILDNLHVAELELSVRPAYRRRGVGSALLESALDLARVKGRTTVMGEVNRPAAASGPAEVAGWSFASNRGFSEASRELHRILDLPVPDERLQALAASAATHHVGYVLVPIDSPMPDELVAGYCHLQEAFLVEAPIGDLDLEAEKWDEKRVREGEARSATMGRTVLGMAALDPSGTMVALTELVASSHRPDAAFIGHARPA